MNAVARDIARLESARTPPAAVESEAALLAALMLDPKALNRVRLQPEDFFDRRHATIFGAILDLDAAGKPFDWVTLGEHLESTGAAASMGGSAYLLDVSRAAYSSANASTYAEAVADKSRMRQVIEVASRVLADAFSPQGQTSVEIVDAAVGQLMALAKADQACEFTMRQAVKLAWADAQVAYEAEGKLRGITSGYSRIDSRLGGWHKGDLIFIGARPSLGKTALMVNLALNAAMAGHGVGMISGEQSAMQIGQRSLAVDSLVPAEVMRNGRFEEEHWPKLSNAMTRLMERRIRILDRSAPTLDDIVRAARRWKQEHGLEVLFVDYLQRIRFKGAESRIEEVSEVARGLKTLARDLDIPVVCLAQVKAEVDKRPDSRPGLGDIANSDEATREADLIGFLYRDEVYNQDTHDAGIAELNFEKNRHGPTGQFRLRFQAETMMFADLPDEREHERQPAAPRRARSVPVSGKDRAARSDR